MFPKRSLNYYLLLIDVFEINGKNLINLFRRSALYNFRKFQTHYDLILYFFSEETLAIRLNDTCTSGGRHQVNARFLEVFLYDLLPSSAIGTRGCETTSQRARQVEGERGKLLHRGGKKRWPGTLSSRGICAARYLPTSGRRLCIYACFATIACFLPITGARRPFHGEYLHSTHRAAAHSAAIFAATFLAHFFPPRQLVFDRDNFRRVCENARPRKQF